LNIEQAKKIQISLRRKLELIPLKKKIRTIAGVDAAFEDKWANGAVCLFDFPGLELVEEAWAVKKITFPYLPGYFSFREAPVLLAP
jgi:deoxyribonuclease V